MCVDGTIPGRRRAEEAPERGRRPAPLPRAGKIGRRAVANRAATRPLIGAWQEIPDLGAVDTPTTIPLHLKYDVGLLPGDTLRLHASGKSLGCLEAQLYSQPREVRQREGEPFGLHSAARQEPRPPSLRQPILDPDFERLR